MTIGHFMTGIWDHGGIAVYIRRVATAQRAAGHTVHFLDDSQRYLNQTASDFRVLQVTQGDLGQKSRELGLDILHLHAPVEPIPSEVVRVVRTVHSHRPYCPSGERYLKRSAHVCDRNYGLTTCLWGHLVDRCGSIRVSALAKNFGETLRERRTLPGIPLIAISRFLKDQMVRSGFDERMIQVLLNPAPSSRRFGPPTQDGTPRFLFMGRLSVHKGVQWLLNALARVDRDFALDVAGDGPQLEDMKALARKLGLQDRVTFHGWVNESRIDELVARVRAVIFPAVWHEPAGLVTLDASARGRAVIASTTGGIPEFALEGRNALLVPPNDETALAQAVERLIDDWDLARQLGESGHAIAEEDYSLEQHICDLESIYRGVPLTPRLVNGSKTGTRHEPHTIE